MVYYLGWNDQDIAGMPTEPEVFLVKRPSDDNIYIAKYIVSAHDGSDFWEAFCTTEQNLNQPLVFSAKGTRSQHLIILDD